MILQISYETREEILRRYPKIETCLKCSLCSFKDGYGCYISNYGIGVDGAKFSELDTYTYNVFGQQEPTKNPNLWLCVSCHRCYEICPYDVNPNEVVEALKAAAFETGHAPELIQGEIQNVLSTSYAFPIAQSQLTQRAKLGLPPLDKTGVDDLVKIARKTGLENRLAALEKKEGGN